MIYDGHVLFSFQFIAFPSPTIKSKIRDWYDILKWLDVFNFILALIGFIIHWFPSHYLCTKVIYCINSIIFFLRIMKIYITNGVLGPKIFMIRRMVRYEPPRDKTNKMAYAPSEDSVSLGSHPVWSESSLCAQWVAKDPRFLHADSQDSDQTGQTPRLIRVFTGRTVILLVLSWSGSFFFLFFLPFWDIDYGQPIALHFIISSYVLMHKEILCAAENVCIK